MISQFIAERLEYAESQIFTSIGFLRAIGFAKQGADVVEHFAGAVTVGDHLAQCRPGLLKIGRLVGQKAQRGVAVGRDRRQRLPDLM